MAEESGGGKPPSRLATVATMIQLLSIVVGVVISVAGYFSAQKKEADSRKAEADARIAETALRARQMDAMEREQSLKTGQAALEAVRPFLQLRQERYVETARIAGLLGLPEGHDPQELKRAAKRFEELYYAELTFVEDQEVATAMVEFRKTINNPSTEVAIRKNATLGLAEALRSSLLNSWRLPFNTGVSTGVSLAGSSSASTTPSDPATAPRPAH